MTLGGEIGLDGVDPPVTVVVVGTFRPRARSGWDSDPLSGAGFEPGLQRRLGHRAGVRPVRGRPTRRFLATGSTRLRRAGDRAPRPAPGRRRRAPRGRRPRSTTPPRCSRPASATGCEITRVASDLPAHGEPAPRAAGHDPLHRPGGAAAGHHALARGAAAGRPAGRRRPRRRARAAGRPSGSSRGQQLGAALLESAVLLAAVAARPGGARRRVRALPPHPAAGDARGRAERRTRPSRWRLVLTVVAGAAAADRWPSSYRPWTPATTGTPSRRRTAARSGVDVLLAGRRRSRPGGSCTRSRRRPTTSGDLALTAGPGAVPGRHDRGRGAGRAAPARPGGRGPARALASLVLPLAANQAARRPHTGTAMVLLATRGRGGDVRDRPARDLGALAGRPGGACAWAPTSPSLLPVAATADDAAAVVAATADEPGSSVVSAVAERPLALGRYVGDAGSPPVLVAIDSRQAGALLRGRLDGSGPGPRSATDLSPGTPVDGRRRCRTGRRSSWRGRRPPGRRSPATPTAVVQDAAGFRSAVGAAPCPSTAGAHRLRWQSPIGAGQLVAVRLGLERRAGHAPERRRRQAQVVPVSVTLRVPGPAAGEAATAWERPVPRRRRVAGARRLGRRDVDGLRHRAAHDGQARPRLPLLHRRRPPGDRLRRTRPTYRSRSRSSWPTRSAPRSAASSPRPWAAPSSRSAWPRSSRPSPRRPGRIAVLADVDTLSRALIHAGTARPGRRRLVGRPTRRRGRCPPSGRWQLGEVTTRADVADRAGRRPDAGDGAGRPGDAGGRRRAILLLAGAGLLVERRPAPAVGRGGAAPGARADPPRGASAAVRRARGCSWSRSCWSVRSSARRRPSPWVPSLIRSDVGAAPVPDAVVAWPWVGGGRARRRPAPRLRR